jgi:hypothetical protein
MMLARATCMSWLMAAISWQFMDTCGSICSFRLQYNAASIRIGQNFSASSVETKFDLHGNH